jgi:hypothetical protein
MQLDKILISVVIISMITIGVGGFISDLATTYNVPTDPEFQAQFNKFNESYDLASDITEDIKGASAEEGTESDWDIAKTIIAALSAVKVVFVQGIPTVFATITGMGYYMPLPEFIIRGLQAIAIISVAFALVYLYFRYKNN